MIISLIIVVWVNFENEEIVWLVGEIVNDRIRVIGVWMLKLRDVCVDWIFFVIIVGCVMCLWKGYMLINNLFVLWL